MEGWKKKQWGKPEEADITSTSRVKKGKGSGCQSLGAIGGGALGN